MNPPPPPPSVSFAPIPPPPAPIIPQAPSQNRDIENGQLARKSEEAAIEKIINKFTAEREISDRKQLLDIRTSLNELLSDWSKKLNDVFVQQQQQIHEHKNNDHSVASIDAVVGDMRERQAKIVEAMQDAHNKQVEVLRAAISDERKESAQTQLIFEQTLKTRYESMVENLHSKIQAESEARIQRSLDSLEAAAKAESERSRASSEALQRAETQLATKFRAVISDLRKSWEEEETGRSIQLEERLRSHYCVVLEHMESQLKMALKLQDDADKLWLEDVENRNRQQVDILRSFEEKCRRLYDTRLREYTEKSSEQLAKYEQELLEAGSSAVAERLQFESRMRRLKLACSRWKMAYQREMHKKYQDLSAAMEERYMSEVSTLLQEISECKAVLADANRSIDIHEKEMVKMQDAGSALALSLPTDADLSSNFLTSNQASNCRTVRETLFSQWNDLKTPAAERVEALASLLDAALPTPQLLARFELLQGKLADRVPIAQAISRRQFLEYKLKLAARLDGSSSASGLSPADKAAFITELTEISSLLDASTKQYEKKYGESYFKTASLDGQGISASSAPSMGTKNFPISGQTDIQGQQTGVKGLNIGSPPPTSYGTRLTPRK